MTHKTLELVVLRRDLPEYGLCKGDVGSIVEIYEPDGLEVEFVAASGETCAVLTVRVKDVRKVSKSDMLAVRPLGPTALSAMPRLGSAT